MQLIPVLLIVLAAAALLGGFFVLIGSEKAQRFFAVIYFLFSMAFAGWSALYVNIKVQNYGFYFGIAFFVLAILLFIVVMMQMKKIGRTRARKGLKLVAISLPVFGVIGATILFLLPLLNVHIEWAALFGTAPIFLVIYFVALKYRSFLLSNRSLKLWSYVIMATASIFMYMLIFYIVSQYLFRVETTAEILAMNLVMIIIVVIIFPIWSEVNTEIDSLISVHRVNLTYVIKRLNNFATQNVKYPRLAEFLAEHLHFRYIGIVLDGKIYGTKDLEFSAEDLEEVSLSEADAKGIWLKPEAKAKKLLASEDIVAVAELKDAKGRQFGQMLIGQPMGKISFEKRDLTEIEMIINIVASIIDSREKAELVMAEYEEEI